MDNEKIAKVRHELASGMQLPKCQKCGCMQETLDMLRVALPDLDAAATKTLQADLASWLPQMQPVRYSCLGCKHCYPAVAQNLLTSLFPQLEPPTLSCDFQVNEASWPPVMGEYVVLDGSAPVAVSTLASTELVDMLASQRPDGLAIAGKTETENIGIDKIIKNMISNPALRYLVVCGADSKGHQTGQTLLALAQAGVDSRQRVIGSPGKRPVLRNVSLADVEQFREQVQIIDRIGCEDPDEIVACIQRLAAESVTPACGCGSYGQPDLPSAVFSPSAIDASASEHPVELDKAGYFVIVPVASQNLVNVEYYDYDNTLRQIIEGETARDIYLTLIERGWVTKLSHAAYLGKELAKAELSLQHGFKYVQDGA